MQKLFVICALLSSLLLSSCSKQKSTYVLSQELSAKMQALPDLIRKVDSEESATKAAQDISALAESVVQIAGQVEHEQYLTHEQRMEFERSLREVQEESEYLLTRLAAQPTLVIKLTDSIVELGNALEYAARVMQEPKSL
jgi:outer membrane murein-binding lipoprotein Lpp